MSDVTAELKNDTAEPEPENESGKMSFLEHLDELRKRLLHIVSYIGIGFIVCWFFSKPIYNFLARPLTKFLPPGDNKLVYTQLQVPFMMYMKVAFIAGIFLTIPFTLYEVWKFISPGLYRREKKYVIPFLTSSIVLFVGGAVFCYYVVFPAAFQFLVEFGSAFKPMITIDDYLDLVNMMLLGFGLIFEMPVVIGFLSLFGLVSASFLWKKFKYSIVIIVTLAAVISPTGDAFNLMVWSAPMILLYIVSIGVAAIIGRHRKAKGRA